MLGAAAGRDPRLGLPASGSGSPATSRRALPPPRAPPSFRGPQAGASHARPGEHNGRRAPATSRPAGRGIACAPLRRTSTRAACRPLAASGGGTRTERRAGRRGGTRTPAPPEMPSIHGAGPPPRGRAQIRMEGEGARPLGASGLCRRGGTMPAGWTDRTIARGGIAAAPPALRGGGEGAPEHSVLRIKQNYRLILYSYGVILGKERESGGI